MTESHKMLVFTIQRLNRYAEEIDQPVPRQLWDLAIAQFAESRKQYPQIADYTAHYHWGVCNSALINCLAEQLFRWRACQDLLGWILVSEPFKDYVTAMWYASRQKQRQNRSESQTHEQNTGNAKGGCQKSRGSLEPDMSAEFDYLVETAHTILLGACNAARLIAPITLEMLPINTRDGLRLNTNIYALTCLQTGEVYRVKLTDEQVQTIREYIQINSEASPDTRVFLSAKITEEPYREIVNRVIAVNWRQVDNCLVSAVNIAINKFRQIEFGNSSAVDLLAVEHRDARRGRRSDTYVAEFFDIAEEHMTNRIDRLILESERLFDTPSERIEHVNYYLNSELHPRTYQRRRNAVLETIRRLHGINN